MTTPRAELEVRINGGASQYGGIAAVPSGATVQFVFPTTVGWEKYRLEMYGPPSWSPPGGWTVESGDVSVYAGVATPPPDLVLPLNSVTWGKWMWRLIVNDGRRNDAVELEMFDKRTGVSMLSPDGLEDVGTQEEAQFSGATRKWVGSLQRALRSVAGSGGSSSSGTVSAKAPVLVATTGNITLSGAQTIDGVSVVATNRVLVKDQTTGSQNGLYLAAAGAWSRATDADIASEFPTGFTVEVISGTVNGRSFWAHTTTAAITLGTTALTFAALIPGVATVAGAVAVESPAGTRITRRLRQNDIDADFAIASWAKTAPNTSTLLYRRGDTITGITGAATYTSGPPTSASVAETYGGSTDGSDVDPGAWTCTTPFATASLAGSIKRSGSNAGADPTAIATLTASDGLFSRNAAWTIQWTSDVYYGVAAAASLVGTDVYNAGIQAGFSDALQTSRGQTRAFSASSQYMYFLWPDEAQYTAGTETFKDNATGFVFPMSDIGSVSITRNGVTRTYRVWRSDNLISSPFTIVVT